MLFFYRRACKFLNRFLAKPLDFVNNSFQKSGFKQKKQKYIHFCLFLFLQYVELNGFTPLRHEALLKADREDHHRRD